MPYSQHSWVDRESQYPNRRILTDTITSESVTVDIDKEEGVVYNEGIQFNAEVMNDLETRIATAATGIQALLNTRLNKIYPVGSVYISDRNISPATIFGGTWESVSGGVLLPSNSSLIPTGQDANSLSIAANAKLSGSVEPALADVPNHSHNISHIPTILSSGSGYGHNSSALTGYYPPEARITSWPDGYTYNGGAHDLDQQTHTHTFSGTASVTGSLNFDNRMPSITVYAWKRTA